MPIKNYTTKVDEMRTVGEIMSLLACKGARSVSIDYDDATRPAGVRFVIEIDKVPIPFRLPCNFEGAYKAMLRERTTPKGQREFERNPQSKEHARNVAWRIIKDWVAAQIAIIEAEQATLAQVFMPYAMDPSGVTTFDRFIETISRQKSLGTAQP